MLRFHLDNEDLILGSVSGRIQQSFSLIRILREDRVKIEASRYASTIKRIFNL
nr:translational initiation factor 1 [Ludwigia hexapetala]WQH59040.1 translational initiation factor 1 [Ludwigia hexapetala]